MLKALIADKSIMLKQMYLFIYVYNLICFRMLNNYAPRFRNSSCRLVRLNVGWKWAPLGSPVGVSSVVKSLKTECHVDIGGLKPEKARMKSILIF